jgi:cytochrome P450
MGVPDASDEDMQRWSQTLIDGAGNFGWTPGPFDATDIVNTEMDKCIRANAERVQAEPDSSALSFMVNAKNPIPESQMIANVRIAIGGGINEPRDALLTILYGLLTNPDQLNAVRAGGKWRSAFEEGVRWVAPIQASSRLVMEDPEIRGCLIPKGDTVMTIPGVGQPRRGRLRRWRELQRAARAQSSPGLWQRPASFCGRVSVAANRWRHPAANAVRALQHDLV